jgi:Porin subfamily
MGAHMKMVRSALLGTAAGLVAVAGAQAADMPVKAAPVQYVKICSLYGDGFYYIPNTDTCIKMGGYLRVQAEYNAGAGGVVVGINAEGPPGRFTRDLTNDLNYRVRGAISWDVRQQTEYGTLRTYIRFGAENTTPTNTGTGTTANPFWDRAFIQFAGFTVGRSQSFFDIFTYGGGMSYHSVRVGPDTGATGQNLWAYTAQFGNGFSGTLSLEDPVNRKGGTADANNINFWNANGVVGPDNAFAVNGVPGGVPAGGFGFRMPDIVINGRVDQAWGYAGISALIHDASGAYYSTATAVAAPGNSVNNGHPADKIGWAVAAGASFNLPGGDTFGFVGCFAEGATGVCNGMAGASMYNASTSVGLAWATDGVFAINPALGLNEVELTRAWSAMTGYQHIWNPRWRTSFFGGYVNVDYNANATAIICANRANIGPLAGAQPGGFNCSPDFSFYEIGTRTQFNPVAQLDIGLEVLYTKLNTAFKGPANVAVNATRPAVNLIDDQGVWSAFLRWQRNFYP